MDRSYANHNVENWPLLPDCSNLFHFLPLVCHTGEYWLAQCSVLLTDHWSVISGGHWPAIRCSLVNQSCLQLQVDAMLPSFLSMVLLLCIRGFLLVVDVFNILGNLCDLCTILAPVLYVMWQLSQSLLPKCIKYDSSALCIK